MSEQPHSAHKPPYNTPSSFGVHYPVNDIVSVIDDRASAEQAVAELRAAGIPYDDVDLASGEQVLEFERDRQQHQGVFGRVSRVAARVLSEDAYFSDQLLSAARAGGTFVVVHAEDPQVLERARPILAAHRPLIALHYRKGLVEELV